MPKRWIIVERFTAHLLLRHWHYRSRPAAVFPSGLFSDLVSGLSFGLASFSRRAWLQLRRRPFCLRPSFLPRLSFLWRADPVFLFPRLRGPQDLSGGRSTPVRRLGSSGRQHRRSADRGCK